jgi:hypothetical protein
MAHQRSNIRSALKTMLIGVDPYNTDAQDRVFTHRTFNKKQLPAIVIYDEQETAIPRDIQGRQSIRKLTCKIEVTIEGTTDYDIALDDLVKQVEDIISANRSLNGTATSSTYTNTELQFEQGEKTIGQAVLTYEITYIV